jgi:hypothetical protein
VKMAASPIAKKLMRDVVITVCSRNMARCVRCSDPRVQAIRRDRPLRS